jgi:hypothetical protein
MNFLRAIKICSMPSFGKVLKFWPHVVRFENVKEICEYE